MRPLVGSDGFQPPTRKVSPTEPGPRPADAQTVSPVAFILRRESQEGSSSESKPSAEEALRSQNYPPTTPRVVDNVDLSPRSTSPAPGEKDADEVKPSVQRRPIQKSPAGSPPLRSTLSNEHGERPPPPPPSPQQQQQDALSPLFVPSVTNSQPSSPKSVSTRSSTRSEMGSASEEAGNIAPSSDTADCSAPASAQPVSETTPQLIMPSINIPSRRPFTSRGKQMGNFKIMVAGGKEVGKTSLIKSIVQICEDIVHVDPLPTTSIPPVRPSAKNNYLEDEVRPQPQVSEINASTRPFPSWWSEIEDSKILRRRIGTGDTVLDRNLCFVDIRSQDDGTTASQYMAIQLQKAIRTITAASSDFAALLSGSGGSQVDVVFYLLLRDTLDADIANIKSLSEMSNVISLISKADLLAAEELEALKTETRSKLDAVSLPDVPYFGASDPQRQIMAISAPYAVSSAAGPDHETMDASLLMSPDYVQPLMPSELDLLIQHVFETDVMACLRHSAAKKLIAWGANHPQFASSPSFLRPPLLSPPQPSGLASASPSSPLNSGALAPFASDLSLATMSSSSQAAMTKLAEHTQQEEHLAQIRLSKWANELQTSLQRERERFEKLARGDRAAWLVEKLGEETRDCRLVVLNQSGAPVKTGRGDGESQKRGCPGHRTAAAAAAHDPLDLLHFGNILQSRGLITIQILGSLGVLGGLAYWLAKTWGPAGGIHEWTSGWGWIRYS